MAKKKRDNSFDDGMTSRSQNEAYGQAVLQMAEPRSKRPRRMAKTLVWGFVIAMPILLIFSFIVAENNRSLNTKLDGMLEVQYNPSYRVRHEDVGAEVIAAWYSNQSPPIDVSDNVSWAGAGDDVLAAEEDTSTEESVVEMEDGETTLEVTDVSFLRGSQTETKGSSKRYEERLEYYALVNGVPHIIGVTIAIPNLDNFSSKPVLVAAPSIIGTPNVSVISNSEANPVEELGEAEMTETSLDALSSWAEAWTENDAAALKQITQDSNAERVYRGIGGGWSYVEDSLSVTWSAMAPRGGGDAVARVTWEMQTPSTVVEDTETDTETVIPGAIQQQTMDVMITDFESGSPSVVAWDQPGYYMELKPFHNALDPEKVESLPEESTDEEVEETTAPTDTATTSDTSGE